MEITKRHFETGRWTRLTIRGGTIESVDPAEGPEAGSGPDEWVAPAFWDIQTNGRWGISFSDPALTVDQVVEIVLAQAEWGAARICPTLITASAENFRHGVKTIAAACESDPRVASCVVGIHLEGPFISEVDGYRGAHPRSEVRDPDWDLFQEFQDASGGRVVLMTLAPERPGAIEFIRKAVASGVVIALGHTAADGPTLRAAVAAGAGLSTHLGNGIASPLPRHPNPIWEQAALDSLDASLIADGHHIDPATLRVLVRAKTARASHPGQRRQPPGRTPARALWRMGRRPVREDRRRRHPVPRRVEPGDRGRLEPVDGDGGAFPGRGDRDRHDPSCPALAAAPAGAHRGTAREPRRFRA